MGRLARRVLAERRLDRRAFLGQLPTVEVHRLPVCTRIGALSDASELKTGDLRWGEWKGMRGRGGGVRVDIICRAGERLSEDGDEEARLSERCTVWVRVGKASKRGSEQTIRGSQAE